MSKSDNKMSVVFGSDPMFMTKSQKKANDWLDGVIAEFFTDDDKDQYAKLVGVEDNMFDCLKNVIKRASGYCYITEGGTCIEVAGESSEIEKALSVRPPAVESRVRARLEFQGFEIKFLRDISSNETYVSGSNVRIHYAKHKRFEEFNVPNALRILKKLVEGTKYDYNDYLVVLGAEVKHTKGVSYLMEGGQIRVSCGFSSSSEVLLWFMYVSWFTLSKNPLLITCPGGDKLGALKNSHCEEMSVATPRLRRESYVFPTHVVRRKELLFNPLVAFRLVRYVCTGA